MVHPAGFGEGIEDAARPNFLHHPFLPRLVGRGRTRVDARVLLHGIEHADERNQPGADAIPQSPPVVSGLDSPKHEPREQQDDNRRQGDGEAVEQRRDLGVGHVSALLGHVVTIRVRALKRN